MKNLRILLAGISSILLFSCYDDLGNYDYKEINEIKIEMESTYWVDVPQVGTTVLTIEPKVSQTRYEGNDNLVYRWRQANEKQSYDVISDKKDLEIEITSNDLGNYIYRFEVEDTTVNITSCHWVSVRKSKPYQRAWYLLQDVDGMARLGIIEGKDGKVKCNSDINNIAAIGLGKIEGTPRGLSPNLSYTAWNEPTNERPRLDIITDKNVYRYDVMQMSRLYDGEYLLFHKSLSGIKEFDITAVQNIGAEVILESGVFCMAHGYSNGFSIFYPIRIEGKDSMDYQATCAYSPDDNQHAIVYDNKHKRLLYFPHSAQDAANAMADDRRIRGGNFSLYKPFGKNNRSKMRQIEFSGVAQFNPSKIDGEVFQMNMVGKEIWTLARSGNTIKVYALDQNALYYGTGMACVGYYEFTPALDPSLCSFAGSTKFEKMLFYTAGNKIYSVDLSYSTPQSNLVYEYTEDLSVQFTTLKFEAEEKDRSIAAYDEYGNRLDVTRDNMPLRLGAAIKYNDSEYGLLSLEINENGRLKSSFEYNQDEQGRPFRKIVDIAYVSLSY